MCCARPRRSESICLTMPWMSLKSDGRQPAHGWTKIERGDGTRVSRIGEARAINNKPRYRGLDNPTSRMTPCVVVVKRNADITLTFDKEGYEPWLRTSCGSRAVPGFVP